MQTNMAVIPENTPTELIDFSQIAGQPRHIEITHRITVGAITIGRFLLKPNPGAVIGTTQYTVLVQEGAPFELEWLLPGSDQQERRRMEPGDIHIHPNNTLVYKRWQASSRMLFMAVDYTYITKVVSDVFHRHSIGLTPRIGIRDPVIEGFSRAWREELQRRGAGGRIHAEALAISLIVHLFWTYGEGGADFHTAANGTNSVRLRKVIDYIESNFGEDISLWTLASIAGLSTHYFNEVFKAEIRIAPHHYLIERRIHHAKEFLLGSDMPIAEIAIAVGFSGQSHFTFNFRKLTGTTPLRFRLAGRSG
jgi:AraC family transcriptional regulator